MKQALWIVYNERTGDTHTWASPYHAAKRALMTMRRLGLNADMRPATVEEAAKAQAHFLRGGRAA